jgi:hypothetical protein
MNPSQTSFAEPLVLSSKSSGSAKLSRRRGTSCPAVKISATNRTTGDCDPRSDTPHQPRGREARSRTARSQVRRGAFGYGLEHGHRSPDIHQCAGVTISAGDRAQRAENAIAGGSDPIGRHPVPPRHGRFPDRGRPAGIGSRGEAVPQALAGWSARMGGPKPNVLVRVVRMGCSDCCDRRRLHRPLTRAAGSPPADRHTLGFSWAATILQRRVTVSCTTPAPGVARSCNRPASGPDTTSAPWTSTR